MTRRILYTGAFRFPDGDAAAARVLGIGKMLRASGYEVEFLGWEPQGRPTDLEADGLYRYQGFLYHSMGDLQEGTASPLRRIFRFLCTGQQTLKWLRAADLSKVDAIIAYHGGIGFLLPLQQFCQRRKIRLLFDCTEWYDPSSLPGGRLGPAAMDSELRMRLGYPMLGRGIVISSYLYARYAAKGCDLALIPPTVDLADEKWDRALPTLTPEEPLRIVYAGIPGKKDVLLNAMLGLAILRKMGVEVVFDVIGPSEAEIFTLLGPHADDVYPVIRDMLRLHGRIPQDKVPSKVSQSHFSLLMRPKKRYARAGFPTKFVESMAAGVPVLTNAIGDTSKYLKDGINGILLRDCSTKAFVEAILDARSIDAKKYLEMRNASLLTARQYFDYRVHLSTQATLVNLLRK